MVCGVTMLCVKTLVHGIAEISLEITMVLQSVRIHVKFGSARAHRNSLSVKEILDISNFIAAFIRTKCLIINLFISGLPCFNK